jgi:trk system potassium uptake protein TrkA
MKVAVIGAGSVGRSISGELLENGHEVLLIDKEGRQLREEPVPGAHTLEADACEVANLEHAKLATFDVVVSATGDDKVNLVVSLLAKTEFSVDRVVARINDPSNEWLFTEAWGVDVAVSTPRVLASLVEEAVSVGDLIRLFSLRQGQADLMEITLPGDSRWAGHPVRDLTLPRDAALVAIIRGQRVIAPTKEDTLEADDELLFVALPEIEGDLRAVFSRSAG